LIAASLTFLHQVMALLLGRPAARIATLAAASLEALTQAADFLHYSTELLPVALLGTAAYAATRRWAMQGDATWNGLGGLALGAVPFGKLQPAPLAALMGLAWLAAEWRSSIPGRNRRVAYLALGALMPAALFSFQLTLAGEWESFLRSYLAFNIQYTGAGQEGLGHALTVMLGNSLLWDRLLFYSLVAGMVWLALMVRLRPVTDPDMRCLTRIAGIATLATLAVILLPQRPYLHYWQLLLLPGTLLLGTVMARLLVSSPPRWQRTERRLVILGAAVLVGTMLGVRAWSPNWFIGDMAYHWHYARTELSNRVAAWSRPGETLAIWGRTDHVYVETGLRQATRDSHFGPLVASGPQQAYVRARYLRDFLRAEPEVFLDSIGPVNPHYVDPKFTHERDYPELAALIRDRYLLVDQFEGARIYRRKDLVAR